MKRVLQWIAERAVSAALIATVMSAFYTITHGGLQ